jgi:hypothetical protein
LNIYNNKILSDTELIRKVRMAAKNLLTICGKRCFYHICKIKKRTFFTYEFHAGSENSKHLADVKSPKGAKVFFNRCLDETALLTRGEIIPNDNIKK